MFIVYVPSPSDLPTADRTNRRWSQINIGYLLAGAVHEITVNQRSALTEMQHQMQVLEFRMEA